MFFFPSLLVSYVSFNHHLLSSSSSRRWADEFEWEHYVRSLVLSSNLFIAESREACPSLPVLELEMQTLLEKKA